MINLYLKSIIKPNKDSFITHHGWNFIGSMFDDFNFIIHPIKKEWGTWGNIFKTFEPPLTIIVSGVFPLVWIVSPNYWIEICLHQYDGFIMAEAFLPQNWRVESVSAGFVEKLWCSFFAQFLYFSIQRLLLSICFYELGSIDSFWCFLLFIFLHLYLWNKKLCFGNGWLNQFFRSTLLFISI